MAVVRRPKRRSNNGPKTLLTTIFVVLFVGIVYIALPSDGDDAANAGLEPNGVLGKLKHEKGKLRMSVERKKEQLREALADSLGKQVSRHLPTRLREMRDKQEIVGERLKDIKDGTETVQELLYGQGGDEFSDKPPMQVHEIIDYLTNWIHLLHDTMGQYKTANYEQIWQGYHDLAVKTLYPWDREYLKRMPARRHDGTIFLSVATYRDENCMNTLKWAYEHAANPEKLFVGLVQQNCEENCKSGVLEGGKIGDTEPDPDCHKIFCAENPERCSQIRALHIQETESLGPYAARYFASKLWDGEEWFMQIGTSLEIQF